MNGPVNSAYITYTSGPPAPVLRQRLAKADDQPRVEFVSFDHSALFADGFLTATFDQINKALHVEVGSLSYSLRANAKAAWKTDRNVSSLQAVRLNYDALLVVFVEDTIPLGSSKIRAVILNDQMQQVFGEIGNTENRIVNLFKISNTEAVVFCMSSVVKIYWDQKNSQIRMYSSPIRLPSGLNSSFSDISVIQSRDKGFQIVGINVESPQIIVVTANDNGTTSGFRSLQCADTNLRPTKIVCRSTENGDFCALDTSSMYYIALNVSDASPSCSQFWKLAGTTTTSLDITADHLVATVYSDDLTKASLGLWLHSVAGQPHAAAVADFGSKAGNLAKRVSAGVAGSRLVIVMPAGQTPLQVFKTSLLSVQLDKADQDISGVELKLRFYYSQDVVGLKLDSLLKVYELVQKEAAPVLTAIVVLLGAVFVAVHVDLGLWFKKRKQPHDIHDGAYLNKSEQSNII